MLLNISFFHRRLYCLLAVLFFFSGNLAHAASDSVINVKVQLSRNRVPAGDMVQLDVQVNGADQADIPSNISVDGLQIRLAGESSQMQMINMSVTSSIVYSYIVIPLRLGTFTIPPIQVRVHGKYFNTSPLQLEVVRAVTSPTSSQKISQPVAPSTYLAPTKQPSSSTPASFAELSIEKKKLYVGEVIPAEIRFYFDASYDLKPLSEVSFGGEGLLVDRMTDPEASRIERDGQLYNVATFRTLISAIKPGRLVVAPATQDVLMEPKGALPPGIDADLLMQLFGNRGGSSGQKVTLKSNSVSLEIFPLPKEGKPANFSGAIGDFHLTAAVTPSKVAVGDPVTLSLKLDGKGNFKAMMPPELIDAGAWKTYPPNDHFEASDDIGWSGVKTFEMTLMAQQPQIAIPSASVSYFDPTTGKYETLTTRPLPISMTPSSTSLSGNIPSPTPTATPQVTPKNQLLNHSTQRHWKDPFHRIDFFIAWLALFGATLFFALYLGIRRYQSVGGSPHHRHRLKLEALSGQLQASELDVHSFFTTAVAYGEAIMSDLFFKTKVTSEDQKMILEQLQAMTTRRNELHYGARELFLSDSERKKILQMLARWHQLLETKK
ncbi:MAG: BatD family protein [Chthoniobacterales bacterium]